MPELGENLFQSGLFVFALIWTIAFLLLRSMQIRRRSGSQSPRGAGRAARPTAAELEPPDAVRQWEVHLHEVARDLSAQVDTKLGLLQQLLTMVEAERARLEELIAQARALGLAPPQTGTEPRGERPQVEAPKSGPRRPAIDRRQQIYHLSDEGMSPAEIARQLQQPLAEVELILSLRSSRRAV